MKTRCSSPRGGAVTFTQTSLLSDPDFNGCNSVFCLFLDLVGKDNSSKSKGRQRYPWKLLRRI